MITFTSRVSWKKCKEETKSTAGIVVHAVPLTNVICCPEITSWTDTLTKLSVRTSCLLKPASPTLTLKGYTPFVFRDLLALGVSPGQVITASGYALSFAAGRGT